MGKMPEKIWISDSSGTWDRCSKFDEGAVLFVPEARLTEAVRALEKIKTGECFDSYVFVASEALASISGEPSERGRA